MTGSSAGDLRAFRIAYRLRQADLATILGIPRQAVIEMEAGRRKIPAWMGLALAAYAENLAPYKAEVSLTARALRASRVNRSDRAG